MAIDGTIRRDYFAPLLKALFARLEDTGGFTNPAEISDLGSNAVRICDFFQKGTALPYIAIGVTEAIDTFDCKQEAGEQVLATIRVFSSYNGMKEINKIAGEVLTQITDDTLDLTGDGMNVAWYRQENTNLTIKEENNIRQRVINILFAITDTATVQN